MFTAFLVASGAAATTVGDAVYFPLVEDFVPVVVNQLGIEKRR